MWVSVLRVVKYEPQGLKPRFVVGVIGTAEAVPFPSSAFEKVLQSY